MRIRINNQINLDGVEHELHLLNNKIDAGSSIAKESLGEIRDSLDVIAGITDKEYITLKRQFKIIDKMYQQLPFDYPTEWTEEHQKISDKHSEIWTKLCEYEEKMVLGVKE